MFPTLLTFAPWGLLILRVAVGLTFLPHGWGKLKNPKAMAQGLGWSTAAAGLLGFVETASALLLILGLLTQLAALLLGLVMLGAIYYKITKWHKKFTGDGGWELDLALLGANIALLLSGGGAWA
ncbi:MAG: DoxX family protein, partial [Patescibacteria group bacterium]